jgi:Head domain of trimeric autotransporter adhesin
MNFNHDTGVIDVVQSIDVSVLPPLGGNAGVLNIVGSGAVSITSGTTAQRPFAVSAGMIRNNTDLTTLEYYNGTTWLDLAKQGTVTSVAVTGSTGLTVGASPITTSGTITLTLGSELQGLSGLAASGIISRTGAGTYASRTLTGTASNITVTNGDGIAGNPTINLATVTQGSGSGFVKITLDTFGRVTGNTTVLASDITSLVDATYVNVTGDTMSGALNMGGNLISSVATPVSGTDAANKNYVDAAVTGLSWKQAVRVATTVNGALATAFANTQVVDGVTLATGDRILIKNQTTQTENGIYVVQATGAPVRSTDSDVAAEFVSQTVFVDEGTVNATSGWTQTVNAPITVGTTNLVYAQFSGSGSYSAGTGLQLVGNTFSLVSPVSITNGGTGLSAVGAANTILGVNTAGTALEYKTITAGTGISVTPTAGVSTIANTGVLSFTQTLPSFLTQTGATTATGAVSSGVTLTSQAANTVLVAPSGAAGTPTFRTLVYADLPIKLYGENPSTPTAPLTSGVNSVAIGTGSNASASNAIAIGTGSNSSITASIVFSSTAFATAGDSQTNHFLLKNITTTATPTELFIDGTGATTRAALPNNSLWTFTVTLSARRTDAVGGGAGYKFEGVMRRDATPGSVTLVGTPAKTVLGETNAGWDAAVSADTTNGSFKILVTGEAAKTIRWVATVFATQVTN